jgi:hypothetical protein
LDRRLAQARISSIQQQGDGAVKTTVRLFLAIAVCRSPCATWADEPQAQATTRAFAGRYAKGAKVIRVDPFGDQLLVLPLWWGGVQPLDRRTGSQFEMQNGRESVFTFMADSLTVTGHRELNGTYKKLGPALAPLELLLAGQNRSAYEGFRKLGLDDKAILDEVRECLVNIPSRRKAVYDCIKYLRVEGVKDPLLMHLAIHAAVMVGDRAAAKTLCEQMLKHQPNDAVALSSMRKLGQMATTGGWKVPFALSDAYAPPTEADLARVRSEWKSRDLTPRGIRREHDTHLSINGVNFHASALSYLVHGQRNFGVVLVPTEAKYHACPVLVELKGVSPSYEPLEVPGGMVTPPILGKALDHFVVFLPAVRGEKLLFEGKIYQCEGNPDDSWDGATDDAISFITAGLESCPEADAKRIVAFGKSRGGTVAMLLGERDQRVRATASWSGPAGWIENMPQSGWSQFELVHDGLFKQSPPHTTAGQAIRTFLKPAIEGKMSLTQCRDRLIASSPIYFVSRLPASQLHYGANDSIVPVEEGRSIEAALTRLGPKRHDISIICEEDGGHDLNPRVSVPTTRQFLLQYAGLN